MVEFSKEDIQKSLNLAIQLTMHREQELLRNRCSERAIAHWLANYFSLKINKMPYAQKYATDYVTDVEYNRIGSEGQYKALSSCDELGCTRKTKCTKFLLENIINNEDGDSKNQNIINHEDGDSKKRRILIDMIYHKRGTNDIDSNIFCMELKTPPISESDYHHMCDKNRIETLVKKGGDVSYQFGATVYFRRSTEAIVQFYEHSNPRLDAYDKYIIYKGGKIENLEKDS